MCDVCVVYLLLKLMFGYRGKSRGKKSLCLVYEHCTVVCSNESERNRRGLNCCYVHIKQS